jgi:protein-disulfide isomerase
MGIEATPTVYVNGRQVAAGELAAAIEEELTLARVGR